MNNNKHIDTSHLVKENQRIGSLDTMLHDYRLETIAKLLKELNIKIVKDSEAEKKIKFYFK